MIRVATALLGVLLGSCTSQVRVPEVLLDGHFEDWPTSPVVVDPVGDIDAEAAVDLGRIWVQDDPRFLYISFETSRPINAQLARGTVRVALDIDGDPTTGSTVDGVPGVDWSIDLSHRPDGAQLGAGMRVFPVSATGTLDGISGYPIDLMASPTHSATRFELRLGRTRVLPGLDAASFVGDSVTLTLTFEDAEGRTDPTEPVRYEFVTEAVYGPRLKDNRFVHPTEGVTRLVTWNVSGQSFYDHPDAFARVLGGLDPHVITLDELPGSIELQELQTFFQRTELARLGDWTLALGTSGGRQKTVVASTLPLEPEPLLLDVPYPADSLARLATETPDSAWTAYLDREREIGLSVAGAWVEIQGVPTLVVGADLQSRGHDGSPFDRLREVQASALLMRSREAVSGRSSATSAPNPSLIVAGDLNLVGSLRPLERLMAGTVATGPLIAVDAYRGTDESMATWRSPQWAPDFTPGRLDYILYAPETFEVSRSLVFDAGVLSEGRRGLMEVAPGLDDNDVTSDHLPVVADLLTTDSRTPGRTGSTP